MLWTSPWLNRPVSNSAFFGAIAIKILLYVGSVQFTILGLIVEFVLNLVCSFAIGLVLFLIVIGQIEEPLNSVETLLLGAGILAANFGVNVLIYGWRINETWSVFFLIVVAFGILALYKKWEFVGAIIIFVMAIINDFIVPFDLSGFGVGASIVSLTGLFLLIYWVMHR